MTAQPLKKAIYDKAKELGIEKIHLNFSGGNDEGYLNVHCEPYKYETEYHDFNNEIEEWAWNVYSYSGAGVGNDYGDDICYNLLTGRVTTSEWFTSRQEGDCDNDKLEIEEDEEELV
jgi:hypothetical protein